IALPGTHSRVSGKLTGSAQTLVLGVTGKGASPKGVAPFFYAHEQKEMDMKTLLRQRVLVNLLMVLGIAAWMILGIVANGVMAQTTAQAPPAAGAPAAAPAPPPKIDTGDTAWVLTSSALVLAMTAPGLALFYGGMVREKNALGTIMHSFIILCLISVQWVLWGYSLAFGPDKGHIVGGLEWVGLAGVTVVHISSGVSGLACALVIGKRRGYGKEHMAPHNLPMTVLGASLLWFGWFGFNAGSAVAAGALATSAFVVTNTATAAAALAWMVAEWLYRGKPTVLGAASGAVAGLVAITPASGFVGPLSSIVIGVGARVFCYLAVIVKSRLGYDDSLDAFGVHGIGGTWGALATGLFASKAINSGGADGLFFGNPGQLWLQFIAVLAAWALAFVGTFVILKI